MLQADPDKVSPRAKKRGLPQVKKHIIDILHNNYSVVQCKSKCCQFSFFISWILYII